MWVSKCKIHRSWEHWKGQFLFSNRILLHMYVHTRLFCPTPKILLNEKSLKRIWNLINFSGSTFQKGQYGFSKPCSFVIPASQLAVFVSNFRLKGANKEKSYFCLFLANPISTLIKAKQKSLLALFHLFRSETEKPPRGLEKQKQRNNKAKKWQ